MRMLARLLPVLVTCLAAGIAAAGDIRITDPWVRVIVQSRPGAGYMTVRNVGGTADRIVSVSSTLAERVEFHTHDMKDGMMRMRRISDVPVPANGEAVFQPGGRHMMIFGLKRMLKPGDRLPLTIVFEKAGAIDVEAVIEGPRSRRHGGADTSRK